MIDHIGIGVTDVTKAKAFYDRALMPLGIAKMRDVGDAAGYGTDRPFFWFGKAERATPTHVAFTTKDRAAVDAFYKAALAAGGRDNGGPGLRPNYRPDYYAAFALDPDGHNIEAVCHAPA